MAWYKHHPSECPLAWVDTETGGLDTSKAALLEVAVIVTDITGRDVRRRYKAKLMPFPEDQMDPAALAVNGYQEAAWLAATDDPAVAHHRLTQALRGTLCAGHNVPYDYAMLLRFMGRFGPAEWPGPHWKVDTVSLAWPLLMARLVPDLKLTTLTSYFGIPHENAHSAMGDAEATRRLYVELMDLYAVKREAPGWPVQRPGYFEGEIIASDGQTFAPAGAKPLEEHVDDEHHQNQGLQRQSALPGV